MMEEAEFELAASFAGEGNVGAVSTDVQLQLYGLFKQAKTGPCNVPKPAFYDLTAKRKWQSWTDLGSLSKSEAMEGYVKLVRSLAPNFDDWCASKIENSGAEVGKTKSSGPVFSSLVQKEVQPSEEDKKELWFWASVGDEARVQEYL